LLDIGGAEATGKATVSVESERKGDEPVVLVIEPDEQQGELLAKSLSLYGYESRLLREIGQWLDRPDIQPSIIVVRDEEFLAGSDKLAHTFPDLPVICLSATDSYAQRYALASAGAEAFYSEPLNLPLIADHLERLLTDHADAATGRVLIVDDDPELREHYLLVLASGGMEVCTVAGDPSRLMPLLYEFRPDIVLMDVQMGDVSGPALARMIRFEPEWLSLPVVYLSAEGDREVQLEALAKGGDDFLTKPVSDSFLLRTARRRCYRARQLDKLVSRDSLTGLLKHALAKAEVEKEHARCQRMKHVSAVAMLDLDHFKNVNDTQGHRAGDLVIKGLANLLRHRLRKTDIIGRYGGEEFLVALPDCDMDQAVSVLEAVCQDFSRIVFEGSSGKFSVTLSVGLSSLADYGDADSAVEAADQALYNRKRAGRNGVTVAPL
jgi:diguanylate cyclase (GGDEF)-like protein